VRWSRLGVFNKIFAALARKGGKPHRLMIDATHLKAHRTAASLLKKDDGGRPLIMLLSGGQTSDFKGAASMLAALPRAREILGDKGCDADWFRQALAERGITACIPSKSNRKIPIEHDRTLYRQRHKIENMFGRLKDWRRVHTRYDRCAHTFMSAICIAAIVSFWINQ
jgi:transposase